MDVGGEEGKMFRGLGGGGFFILYLLWGDYEYLRD